MGHPDWNPGSKAGLDFQITKPANPGTNADVTLTVPPAEQWRILSLYSDFTADANVASRTLILQVEDGVAARVFRLPSGVDVTAGQTRNQGWVTGFGAQARNAGSTIEVLPVGELYAQAGWVIRITATNKHIGDRHSNVLLLAERVRSLS